MTMTRTLRRLICRGLIGLVLFTQLAVASYICPAVKASGDPAPKNAPAVSVTDHDASSERRQDMTADAANAAMVPCDQMAAPLDKASPNLCAEQSHYGQQSVQVHTLASPAVALVCLYPVGLTMVHATPPMSATAESVDSVAMAPPPPHAILHCCIRD